MKDHFVRLVIPHTLYEPLQQISAVTGQRVEDVILQTLRNGMPPSLRKVPSEFHDELLALNKMDDVTLWDVIQGSNVSAIHLDDEHDPADFSALRRAYAFSLLRWRGHPVPSPHEMMLDE